MTVEVRTLGRDCKVYEDIVFSNLQKDKGKNFRHQMLSIELQDDTGGFSKKKLKSIY